MEACSCCDLQFIIIIHYLRKRYRCICSQTQTQTHIHAHTHTHTELHTHAHTHTHTCAYPLHPSPPSTTTTHVYTDTHACTQTHTHTHAHTHKLQMHELQVKEWVGKKKGKKRQIIMQRRRVEIGFQFWLKKKSEEERPTSSVTFEGPSLWWSWRLKFCG